MIPVSFSSFCRDPKKSSLGSFKTLPGRGGRKTQHVPRHQLPFLLHVVFIPCLVTDRSPPEKGGVVIPCACYTSGKS